MLEAEEAEAKTEVTGSLGEPVVLASEIP